jgi:hypothetical protein
MADFPNLRALQERSILKNVRDGGLLKPAELAAILSPQEFSAYQVAAIQAQKDAQIARDKPAPCSDEALAFWNLLLAFYADAWKVWIMRESNKTFREAKSYAEKQLFARHGASLQSHWNTVRDREAFSSDRTIHELFDVGYIPSFKMPLKERERIDRFTFSRNKRLTRQGKPIPAPLVLNRKGWIIRTEWDVSADGHECVPWAQQVRALETHFGPSADNLYGPQPEPPQTELAVLADGDI